MYLKKQEQVRQDKHKPNLTQKKNRKQKRKYEIKHKMEIRNPNYQNTFILIVTLFKINLLNLALFELYRN